MIGISDRIKQALNALGVTVWHDHPQNWAVLPAVTWRESLNRECTQAFLSRAAEMERGRRG